MRFLSALALVSFCLASGAVAVPPPAIVGEKPSTQEAAKPKPDQAPKDDGPQNTIFNDQEVPPLRVLNGTTLDEDISTGYWLVEFYSPYCGHCKALAPIWQTLYEFYYTSNPVPAAQQPSDSQSSLNSFTRYYNFKFGKLDCVAFGTACGNKGIDAFPTLIVYKDGKEIKKRVGGADIATMAGFVEEILESIRPGSRPSKDDLILPKVGAREVATPTKAVALPSKTSAVPTKTTVAPNPSGTSIPLDPESFAKLVTTTREPWFIKFYVPWCPHCQAMAPNWDAMSRQMKGKLNVGEVNCEVEKTFCKDMQLNGYPTMLYFQGGERVEYESLRGLGDLIDFATKAVGAGSGVMDVSAAEFEEMEKTEEVIFVYFYDHATTTEDFQALERLLLQLIGHARLVKTKDPKLCERYKISTWPRLLVSRDGKPTYYPPIDPKSMRDVEKMLAWMQANWLPIVPELTGSNAKQIMDGKLVVLGILSRDRSDEFIIAKREIKNAALEWIDKQTEAFKRERQELRDAKQLRIEEAEDRNNERALRNAKSIRINMDEIPRKEVGFAWVDGVFWERWIRTTYGIDVKDGERVIINDEHNRRYWDTTITGNPTVPSRTSILETLPKVIASPPKISPKSTAGRIERVFFQIRHACMYHPWIMIGMSIGFVASLGVWYRARIRRNRAFGSNTGGFFQSDGKEGLLGMTNGSPGGKVD